KIPHEIWEPAVGRGAIARVLESAGHRVIGTDLIDYGVGYEGGVDFLKVHTRFTDCIVTNPPFKIANAFVAHALELCPRVIMLLRLAFLESERRTGILEGRGLARVHVFRKRLPMMHRALRRGPHRHEAYDRDEQSLGSFSTAAAAANAVFDSAKN